MRWGDQLPAGCAAGALPEHIQVGRGQGDPQFRGSCGQGEGRGTFCALQVTSAVSPISEAPARPCCWWSSVGPVYPAVPKFSLLPGWDPAAQSPACVGAAPQLWGLMWEHGHRAEQHRAARHTPACSPAALPALPACACGTWLGMNVAKHGGSAPVRSRLGEQHTQPCALSRGWLGSSTGRAGRGAGSDGAEAWGRETPSQRERRARAGPRQHRGLGDK